MSLDNQKESPAGITVFLSLMLMLMMSLLFALLETSRYYALEMEAVLNSRNVTESVFAEYHIPAYQDYHLLLLDCGYGSGELNLSQANMRMQMLGQENLNPEIDGFGGIYNFLLMDVTDSSILSYELTTDQSFLVLAKQMVQVMKQELALDLLEQVRQEVAGASDSQKQGRKADHYIDSALDTIQQAQQETTENEENPPAQAKESTAKADDINNPIEEVKSAQNSPLLAQILPEGATISAKQLVTGETVSKRTRNTGNYGQTYTIHAADKLLLVQYLCKYFSCHQARRNIPHALVYEQEYLLAGKSTDEENLNAMAIRLLGVREGLNFAYLLTDSAKRGEAMSLAVAIATAAGIPEAATAIQMGILASWAYAESVAELRTLFSGGKVAAVKSASSWTVDLSEVTAVLMNHAYKAKEIAGGMSYKDYLHTFLYIVSTNSLLERFADLLEKNLQLYEGYEQSRLDCMLTAAETSNTCQAEQIFLSFVTLTQSFGMNYTFEEKYNFSYLAP